MPKILSIHSFRRGTGRSILTANLATIVAGYGHRVGIVDTHIQFPAVHVLFGVDENKIDCSLNDYLWGCCLIEEAAYEVSAVLGRTGTADSKLYLVPSSPRVKDITRVLKEGFDINRLLEGFQKLIEALNLDYLFIDTHPGLNEETLLSISVSDILVLILRPDQQDFMGTAVTAEVARKLKIPKTLLMINMASPSLDFEALGKEVEKSYNMTVAGIVPFSEDVIQESNAIFCLRYPEHPISREIEKVAQQIMG